MIFSKILSRMVVLKLGHSENEGDWHCRYTPATRNLEEDERTHRSSPASAAICSSCGMSLVAVTVTMEAPSCWQSLSACLMSVCTSVAT